MAIAHTAPIGVFDSGLGGLTVLRELQVVMPHETFVYLGDTARLPYGIKSEETVIRYALSCAQHLVEREVKAIVVACNTVSSVALSALRSSFNVPVFGVIEPSAAMAVKATKSRAIGVLATTTTVGSSAYQKAVASLDTEAKVVAQAAPLLVPLIEEGWVEGEVPERVVERYVRELFSAEVNIDALLLGCTHYPLIKNLVSSEVHKQTPHPVQVIDSATAVAHHISQCEDFERTTATLPQPEAHIMVTDRPKQFEALAVRFLGTPVSGCELIDLKPC